MEISARPRSRTWHRLAVALSSLTVLLTIGLLVPAAVGLQQGFVSDDAMGGRLARGALAFQSSVDQAGELGPGDVISFVAPDAEQGAAPVTRRIVAIDGFDIRTRGDNGAEDPWTLRLGETDVQLVAFSVPYAGYPQLLTPALTWPLLTLLFGAAAAAATWRARRQTGRRRLAARLTPQPSAGVAGGRLATDRVVSRL